ncbi:Helix-turn-helix domain-containing protein [Clostridium cavendishii DSM 21758]|uniref:Helix-turn-helix domain-containing protein n=1 Tax=Clostridium cavendishii DSM 21758 TaxID=1121302 RepID=A0A1M6IWJ8_9CLOT|nr:helix-turn-helix transcriptional regulator [Clostridium cavendishii]SHJ38744.1 Helix-turn-helix domain-containing protein [Clostridium cavendishii DSM 21758]
MNSEETSELYDLLSGIKDEEKLESYMKDIKDKYRNDDFASLFYEVCKRNNLKNSDIISKINISRSHYYDIINGVKNPTRDKIIQLCIVAGFTVDETQKALTRTKCGILHSKSERDTIIIFCIVNRFSLVETNEKLYDKRLEILV